MELKETYCKHYGLNVQKVREADLCVMSIDGSNRDEIYNLILVPDTLYFSFRSMDDPMLKIDETKLSPKQKCDYYRKLADMYEELAVWQLSKDIEDIRLSNPDIVITGIGYEDLR